jgi:undecaprenyl-diphosphatase
VFLGHNLPLGVFAGAVLGWGTGALFHLVLGAPGRRMSQLAIEAALRQAGIEPVRVITMHRRLLRPQEFEVETSEGELLQMKIVRRLHRLAGPGYKLRRAFASLEVEHEPALSTPRHEVEHEAYITLLAERAGIGVLPVLLAGEIAHGPPFLVRRHIVGRLLSTLERSEIHDTLLDEIWRDVAALGEEHIAHHDLRAANILVDDAGHPRITDFTLSRAGGPAGQGAQDVAEMLVSITSVVGVRRAVESAVRSLPAETLQESLPHLQWLALHRRLRVQCDNAKVTLAELRETLAERLDVPVPPFRSPVRPSTVAMMAAGGVAVYLLLPQLSSMQEVLASLADADRRWLAAAIATGLVAIIAETWAVLGSSPQKLPFGKTLAVQVAATFTGRTTAAGVGFYGINLVFLERLGLRRSHAVGVILLNRIAMGVVGAVGTGVGILVIGSAVPVGDLAVPTSAPVLAAVAVVVVGVVSVLVSPFGRRRLWRPAVTSAHDLARDLLPVLRQPLRATQLLGGSVLFLTLSASGLAATLAAFGTSFPVIPVLAVFVVGSTIGQIAPTPGGLGAVEAALVAGLTAVGVPSTEAVAAVLASRVLTFWFPVLPGVVAFRLLQRRGIV